MTDPTLTSEIAQARAETNQVIATLESMGLDLEAVKATDRVRDMALTKLRADWDYLKDRLHYLANRFLDLQERHLTLVEGEPPPPEKERP